MTREKHLKLGEIKIHMSTFTNVSDVNHNILRALIASERSEKIFERMVLPLQWEGSTSVACCAAEPPLEGAIVVPGLAHGCVSCDNKILSEFISMLI